MKNKLLFSLIVTLLIAFPLYSQQTDHLSVKTFPDKEVYSPKDTVKLALQIDIKEKFHINSFKTDDPTLIKTVVSSNPDGYTLLPAAYPEDKLYKFEFSENKVRVYEGKIFIGLRFAPKPGISNGDYNIPVTLNYQACDNSVCYPPKKVDIKFSFKISSDSFSKALINQDVFKSIDFSKASAEETPKTTETKTDIKSQTVTTKDEEQVSKFIEEKGLFVGLLLIFLGGLALNLTPCVYPLIPITISYFGAQASGNRTQSIFMGVFYALGMSVTYSTLGLFAAVTGSLLGNALQNPIVIIFVAMIFIALSLSMFGLYEIRVPQKLALAGNKNRTGFLGSFLMGLLVGFIAAPCIGPFVLSLLVYVGKLGNPFMGFLLFFVLSMGLGFPYIILAASSSSLNKLPRSGEWMEGVKIIFGLILIGMGISTLAPVLGKEIYSIAFPSYLILAGAYLILIDKKGLSSKAFTKFKYIAAVLAIIYGAWNLKPEKNIESVSWKMLNSVETIQESIKSEGKPVMIDFYADWCAQCKELDEFTYTDKEIIDLSKSLNNIKIDLTKENKDISDKFGIKGLPVVIFMNSKGEELKELRVTGFLKPEEFAKKIKALKEK